MEPITHLLTGACLARSGFNRRTAYATLAMTLAAEAPDLDVIWSIRGPVAGFEHHRGITHTLIGAPFVALAVTGVVYLYHRVRKKPSSHQDVIRPSWLLLWLFSWIAVLSHLLLDFTNNYGLRPFFPFNARWYSWDIVFIFEPLMFAALLLALVMPAILGLADREIGARRKPFRGRGWAIAALAFLLVLYGVRNAEHQHALTLLRGSNVNDPVLRVGAEPYPINPFHWYGLIETAKYFQTGDVSTRNDSVDLQSGQMIYKPQVTMATLAAKRSWLGHIYLDWSSWPVTTDLGNQAPETVAGLPSPLPQDWHTVEFRDLRFGDAGAFLRGSKNPPLTGYVYVGPESEIEATVMNGREQK